MRSHCSRLCSTALVFLMSSGVVAAQKGTTDSYSGESFVAERSDVVYMMNADGTGYMQKTVAVKIQSEAALQQCFLWQISQSDRGVVLHVRLQLGIAQL
jgi:hypothetical protein